MPDSKKLPVLQGHWRLLEPNEVIEADDQKLRQNSGGELRWTPTGLRGLFAENDIIRRRVPPPPTCGTCRYWRNTSLIGTRMGCTHDEGLGNARSNSYCSNHPKAQEVTR